MTEPTDLRELLDRAKSCLFTVTLAKVGFNFADLLKDIDSALAQPPDAKPAAWQCPRCGYAWDENHKASECTQTDRDMYKGMSAAPQPPAGKGEEVAWMIECKEGFTGWWDGREPPDCRFFDKDPNEGVRFTTKEEAEQVIKTRGNSCMIATEHKWVDLPKQDAIPREIRERLVAEKDAEIERLKEANAHWHVRVEQLKTNAEAAERLARDAKREALRGAAAFFEREVQEYAKWSSHTVSTKLRQLASEHGRVDEQQERPCALHPELPPGTCICRGR
jgi:hypothetical protein